MTRRTTFLSVLLAVMTISSVYYMIRLSDENAALTNQFAPSGVISFELSGSKENAERIARQWVNDGLADEAIEQIETDYRFIACYVLAYGLGLLLLARAFQRRSTVDPPVGVVTPRSAIAGKRLAWFLLGACVAAGALDVVENLGMLTNLRDTVALAEPAADDGPITEPPAAEPPAAEPPATEPTADDGPIDEGLRQRTLYAARTKFLLIIVASIYLPLGVVVLNWHQLGWVLRRLYLTRVPLLVGVSMQLLALVAIAGPPTIQNLLITTKVHEPVLIAFQVVLTYVLGVFSARVICRQASPGGRFHVPNARAVPAILDTIRRRTPAERAAGERRPANWFALIMCAPLLAVVVLKTEIAQPWWAGALWATGAILLGTLLALVLLFLIRDEWTGPAVEWVKNWKLMGKLGRRVERWVGPGYADQDGDLNREQVRACVTLAVLAGFYSVAYFFFRPDEPWCDYIPALAYLLGWLILMLSLLSGATYLLDRFHVPLLTAILLWNVAVFQVGRVDHYFVLYTSGARGDVESMAAVQPRPAPDDRNYQQYKVAGAEVDEAGPASDLPSPQTALEERWALTEDVKKPRVVTVVCAAGGGIQAAGWTARVLQGLCNDKSFGQEFQRSLALMSATSGGSVGTMHFLEAFPPAGATANPANPANSQLPAYAAPDPQALQLVFNAAVTSSLEESVWGLTLPDTLRLLLPLPIFDPVLDRSWAIEQAWLRNGGPVREAAARSSKAASMKSPKWSTWVKSTRAGRMPAVVFNTTVVETGSQMRISTVSTDGSFHQYYSDLKDVDMDVSTAARLSATFPYITPVARARIANGKKLGVSPPTWHFADGGYFDNSGILAAIDWLRAVLEDPETKKRIDKVLVIQITPFPPTRDTNPYNDAKGWSNAALGPITTIAKVRSTTQIARGQLELDLLSESYGDLIHRVVIRPMDLDQDESPPLSWHLADHNKQGLQESWRMLDSPDSEPLAKIRKVFEK